MHTGMQHKHTTNVFVCLLVQRFFNQGKHISWLDNVLKQQTAESMNKLITLFFNQMWCDRSQFFFLMIEYILHSLK